MALPLFNRNLLEDATGELCLEPEGIPLMGENETLEQKVTRIFQALRLPVYYYLIAFLGDAATADDLTQEVFLRLYAHLHRGRPVENVRLWVFRVAHNLAFDERRRHQRLARLDESAWDEICARLPDPALNPEQRALERERLERLGKVRGENEISEYELSETAYEVIPLAALTVFTDPAPKPAATGSPAPSSSRIPAPPTVATPPLLPTRAELLNAEIAALYSLHQLKADLGEQIEIARESNEQIVVRGQVETPERKQELIAALKGIPFVTTRIQTFAEATVQSARAAPPPPAAAIIAPPPRANSDSSPAAGVNLFERRLARYFAERGGAASEDTAAVNRRIAQMANSAFAESSAALASGWALRRMAAAFDDGPGEQMSMAAATRLREVISNHLAEINTRSRNLRKQLEPALISIAGTRDLAASLPLPVEKTRKARVMRLFKAVEQVQRLSYRLFASGQTFAASPEEAARLMLQAFEQLDAACLALEQDGHR